ncbi:MAG: DUF58 domain-containing protein [Armatimonadota bacterium]|nr:DUF58 domain-containing protein [Armatimonadota bacterium]MDW8026596.1 DUF58 domain-containing protein [Armatimonadota bacterium]
MLKTPLLSMPKVNVAMLDDQLLTRLERMRLNPRRLHSGLLHGERISKKRGISVEFSDFRPYAIGDDARHLDWKIYARLDRPIIRTYRDETELPVYLMIDASVSMNFGNPPKWNLAQQLAAALGYIVLCGGDALFPIAISVENQRFTFLRGKAMFLRLINWLRSLQPTGKGLASYLRQFAYADVPKGMALLLSDGLDSEFPNALQHLASRGHEVLFVHILSDAELEPSLEGDLKLLDCETDESLDLTATDGVIRDYMRNLGKFCSHIESICRRSGGWCIRVRSNASVSDIIFRQLRQLGVVKMA